MNSLRATRLMSQTVSRRFASTSAVPKVKTHNSFRENWLSDPSTYPIIVIMGSCLVFMVGMSANALMNYKDVTISPEKRNQTMRTWGQEDTPHLLKRAVYWNSWQKNAPEGLGVDHDKWIEEKKARDGQ